MTVDAPPDRCRVRLWGRGDPLSPRGRASHEGLRKPVPPVCVGAGGRSLPARRRVRSKHSGRPPPLDRASAPPPQSPIFYEHSFDFYKFLGRERLRICNRGGNGLSVVVMTLSGSPIRLEPPDHDGADELRPPPRSWGSAWTPRCRSRAVPRLVPPYGCSQSR
jgi:hypothetical protein